MKIALALLTPLGAFLLFLLGCLFLLVVSSPCLPNALALGDSLQQLLVILWLALFTIVFNILKVLVVNAHANADVMLPGMAAIACDPWIVRIITVLACGTANTAYDFFLVFWFGFCLLLSGGFLSTALRFDRLLEGVGVAFVLAFGAAHRPARFGFACGHESVFIVYRGTC